MRTTSVILDWVFRITWCVVLVLPNYANCQLPPRAVSLPTEKEFTVAAIMGVQSLQLTEGEMPSWTKDADPHYPHHYQYRLAMSPYVIMDNGEFAIVTMNGLNNDPARK